MTTAPQSCPPDLPDIAAFQGPPPRSLGKLAEALAKAQGEMAGAKKDSANPFFKSKYADLASVWEAARAPLSKHALAVIQTTAPMNGNLMLETTLVHSSGESVTGYLPIIPAKERDPQALGSAITYARRYALAAIVGIAPEDDDGEAAMARPSQQQGQQGQRAKQGAAPPRKGLDALVVPPADDGRMHGPTITLKDGDPMPPGQNPLIDALVASLEGDEYVDTDTGEITPISKPTNGEPRTIEEAAAAVNKAVAESTKHTPRPTATWRARADATLDVAMPVRCGFWNEWADQPIPASRLHDRANTWRLASEGKKGGGRHALLLDLVVKAVELPTAEVTLNHERAVCTLAVLLAKSAKDPERHGQPREPSLPGFEA